MTVTGKHLVMESSSVEETLALGERLGRTLVGGLAIGLVGTLGSGKTYFVKGIAAGNGPDQVNEVTSPTFTLVNEYAGTLTLYHLDTYRLKGPGDLAALGFDEMISPDSVVAVEWADRVRSLMPDGTLWVELESTGETSRRLTFRGSVGAASRCLEVFRKDNDAAPSLSVFRAG